MDIEIHKVLHVTKRQTNEQTLCLLSHWKGKIFILFFSLSQIFPMMKNCAILLLLCVLHIAYANDELTLEIESDELMKTGDLEHAETKDASATEIIKQIRKLNPDGTFTIGFEAVINSS